MDAVTDYSNEIEAAAALSDDTLRRADLNAEVRRLSINTEARRIVKVEEAARQYKPLGDDLSGTLRDLLNRPRLGERHRIEGLLGMGHNAVLGAQYKTGKTTLGVNLLKSCADGIPFLDRQVTMGDGSVAWLNGEMERDDWLDYVRPLGIQGSDLIVTQHLRGKRLPLMNDYVAEEFIKWLTLYGVEFLIVDSWRRLCTWSGVNENRNDEVDALTDRIDWIKQEAGVSTFLALAHTGRGEQEEGREHVRGATALDDWVDARWIMTTKGTDRFFFAEGRGVAFDERQLVFDRGSHRLDLGQGTRKTIVSDRGAAWVEECVAAANGARVIAGDIKAFLTAKGMGNATDQVAAIKSAQDKGLVHSVRVKNANEFHMGPSPMSQAAANLVAHTEGPMWS